MDEQKHVQVISCGPGLSPINSRYGKSSDWVSNIIKDKVSHIEIVKAYEKEIPALTSNTVWIIMGSRYSVYDQIEWMDIFKQNIQKGIENKIPMLGVCFGHQILCSVLGGKVINNPEGWEIGSAEVALTEKGKKSELFKDFSPEFSVYESHHDAVVDIPSNIDILAQNKYGLQAFSYSDFIFGVQFHPEFNFDVMKAYHSIRIEKIQNKKDYRVCNENEGVKVVDNFINIKFKGDKR